MATRDILSAAERQAAVADGLSATYARELARVKGDLEIRLRRLIIEAQAGSETATGLAARALVLRQELRDLLTAAGYDDLAEVSTVRGLDRMVRAIAQLREASNLVAFTTRDATRIAALKELARLNLLAQGDQVGVAVWRSVLQGVYGARTVPDILDDLTVILQKELHEVGTLYDTAVSIFGRQVQVLKSAGGPDELLLYAGPIDARTRPFCWERAGKVYRRRDVEGWDNGNMPGPPELVAGGWNCRHLLVPLSPLSDLMEIAGTGQRVPEMQAQVDAALAVRNTLRSSQRRTPLARRGA